MAKAKGGKSGIKAPDDKIRTARQPHRRPLKPEQRTSERAESPLGQLVLRAKIDEDQYDAGETLAAIVAGFRLTIASPAAVSGTLGHLAVGDYPEEEMIEGEGRVECFADQTGEPSYCRKLTENEATADNCVCFARRRRYMRAFEALMECELKGRPCGRMAVLAVMRVVIYRQPIAPQDFIYLKLGLSRLTRHFGLTGPRGRAD